MKNLVLTEQSILKVANTINKSIIENGEFPNSDIYYKISILNDTDVVNSDALAPLARENNTSLTVI